MPKKTEFLSSLGGIAISYYALSNGQIDADQFTAIVIALGLGYTTSRTIIKALVPRFLSNGKTKVVKIDETISETP